MRSAAPKLGTTPSPLSFLPSTDVMRLSNYAGINVRQANKGMAAASIKTKTFRTRGQMLAGRQVGRGWEGCGMAGMVISGNLPVIR